MDTGATTHTATSPGSLTSYSPINHSSQRVIVGNGHGIPVLGTGHTTFPTTHHPLHLNQVLHAPNIVKNLVSVRRLTTDNNISVSFDPFGFSVSDFQTGIPLMRCDSVGDLYPVTFPSSFVGLTSRLWHRRLGHPGASILQSLSKNNFISCTPSTSSAVCPSFVLGNIVGLRFFGFLLI